MINAARFCLAALVALPLAAAGLGAQKKQTARFTNIPVTASFRCPMEAECPGNDGISGDALGTYTGESATAQGPYFNSNYHLYFPLQAGMGRFVGLDFSAPIGVPACAAAGACYRNFTSVYTDDSQPPSITNPVDAAGGPLPNGFYGIAIGQTVTSRYKFNFPDPSGRALLWTVRFNSNVYPGSSDVTVTRVSENVWVVEATAADVAELVVTPTRGRSTTTSEGFYSMPFRITVTR